MKKKAEFESSSVTLVILRKRHYFEFFIVEIDLEILFKVGAYFSQNIFNQQLLLKTQKVWTI